jgi:UDP-glucose 4-epimerase
MTNRALITGGAGFVGHHLAGLLLENGCDVLVLDNFSVGKWENIVPFVGRARFGLAVADVTDERAVAAAMDHFRPETVFHLAAIHFIPYCTAHPTETMQVNALGTQHLLEAARNTPSARRFVFASTADVYKPQDGHNVEDETPTGSLNIYGITKLCGEDLIRYYRTTCPEITFTCARFFNVYGPGETNPHVLPDIFAGMAESDRLRLGDVSPKRDFVYVTDVARALCALAESAAAGTEVNVATGREYSVRELVKCIGELTGRELTIERDPARFRPSERMHLVGDIRKIRRLTGWEPAYSLESGLAELLAHEGLIRPGEPVQGSLALKAV